IALQVAFYSASVLRPRYDRGAINDYGLRPNIEDERYVKL
ncbi:MAG: hypothetical protein JWN70_2277, partial [Planctomycetaceae bacterium]|nr:hypothetical protein [Planctomycetaceae bacterium]